MQGTLIAFASVFVLGSATLAAQQPAAAANRTASKTVGTPAAAAAQVDVNRLPLNLSRLQRRLRAENAREAHDGLNLKYFVDVYAPAPPLTFFTKEDKLDTGPVPHSSPTHRDMLRLWTPRGLQPPPSGRIGF